MRGLFISFEGTEGSGKTSVIKSCEEFLKNKGFKVILTREPGGIKISEQIRNIILSNDNTEMDPMTEALLFAASRRQHLVEKIIPALNDGYIVLCDRYVDSSLVYQGISRGIGLEKVLEINRYAIDDLFPDLTIFIDVRPEVGLKRVFNGEGREINRLDLEKLPFHQKIYDGYVSLCDMFSERIKRVNGEQDRELVSRDSIELIKELLRRNNE